MCCSPGIYIIYKMHLLNLSYLNVSRYGAASLEEVFTKLCVRQDSGLGLGVAVKEAW